MPMPQPPHAARLAVPIATALVILALPAAGEVGPLVLSEGWRFRAAPEHEAKALVGDPADVAIARGKGGEWRPIKPTGTGWYEQGFNPPRAGWYLNQVPLPDEWAGLPLALELDARCTAEAVYADGAPVGAREHPPGAERALYLLPPRDDVRRPLLLAIRLDAPGVAEPGLAAPPVLRPAAMREYMTPLTTPVGAQLHRPPGLDFFPNPPVHVASLLVNAALPRYAGAFVRGEPAGVTIAAAPAEGALHERKLEITYLVTDDLTGEGVSNGEVVLTVPPEGTRQRINVTTERAGSYTVRLLVSSEGEVGTVRLHYAVFPDPSPTVRASPLGLVMTAPPVIAHLSGTGLLAEPAVLSRSFLWEGVPVLTPDVIRRVTADARAGGYTLALPGAGLPDLSLLSLPPPDSTDPAGLLKRSYLDAKSSGKSICLLMTTPQQCARLGLGEPEAAWYCDVFCSECRLPIDFEPESFIPAFVRRVRSAIGGRPAPAAPAVLFSASYAIQPSYMVRSTVLALAAGARYVLWNANGPGDGAWMRRDGSPLPPLPAFACMAGMLGKAHYLGRPDYGPDVYAYAFNNGAENLLVVWKTGGPQTLHLPPARRAAGTFGADIAFQRADNHIELMVSSDPVFLCGVDQADLQGLILPDWTLPSTDDLVGRREELCKVDPARVILAGTTEPLVRHGSNKVSLTLENRSKARIAAKVALDLPEGWACEPAERTVTLRPFRPKQTPRHVEFAVTVPPGAPLGEYAGSVMIIADARRTRASSLRLRLTTPVGDLAGIRLAEVHTSAPSIAVPVENPFDEPVIARLHLGVSNWAVTPGFLPVELGPRQQRLLRFLATGRLPVVGPLNVGVTIRHNGNSLTVLRRADISQQRLYGVAIGKPEVQALRFDGRRLSYRLSNMTVVSVRIYNENGKLVGTLDSGWQSAGPHNYEWTPGPEPEDAQRPAYCAEVRAGMEVIFDRSIGPPAHTIFAPGPAAVNADGDVCVFDGRRAVKFSRNGDYLGSDLPAEEAGDLVAIAPLPNGRYVGLRPDQLLLLDSHGAVLRAQPRTPRPGGDIEPGHFRRAAALDVSPTGTIYVVDSGNHRVQRFNSDLAPEAFDPRRGNALGKLDAFNCPVAGTGEGEFTLPTHVAVSPDGCFAVADATGRLQVFDQRGGRVSEVALAAARVGAIALDGTALYVAAADQNLVTKYIVEREPRIAAEFGDNGTVRFGTSRVRSLEPDGRGGLIVCSDAPGEVAVLDAATGAVKQTIGAPPPERSIAWPAGIDVDDAGTLFVADPTGRCVYRISAGGETVWSVPGLDAPIGISEPSDVVLTPGGSIYVLDNASPLKRLVALDFRGQPAAEFGDSHVLESEELSRATTLDRTPAGYVWAGNGSKGVLITTAGAVIRRDVPPPVQKGQAGGILYQPWCEGGVRGVILTDVKGREIARKGGLGTQAGRFAGCTPGGIAARAGAPGKPDYVYYADTINHRIVVLRVEWNCVSRTAGEW